jgi:preprotein translocase subunit SecE
MLGVRIPPGLPCGGAPRASRGSMVWLSRLRSFFDEVKGELKRTTWPSRKEVRGTTTVVIVTVFIFAVFLYVVDIFLFTLVDKIFAIWG